MNCSKNVCYFVGKIGDFYTSLKRWNCLQTIIVLFQALFSNRRGNRGPWRRMRRQRNDLRQRIRNETGQQTHFALDCCLTFLFNAVNLNIIWLICHQFLCSSTIKFINSNIVILAHLNLKRWISCLFCLLCEPSFVVISIVTSVYFCKYFLFILGLFCNIFQFAFFI